jgi:hypothetical protein
VNRAVLQITFSGTSARSTVVACPAGGPGETSRIAVMVNPAITVRAGARVSIRVINADQDAAHGLVINAPRWGGVLDAGDDHLARLHRVSGLVSRQPDIRGHAPGDAQLSRHQPRARPEGHDGIIHRQPTCLAGYGSNTTSRPARPFAGARLAGTGLLTDTLPGYSN